jgi:iron(III) transport system permease protein
MAAITAALFLFLFIFLIWPLGEMVARSLIGKNGLTGALYYEAITQPRFGKAFYNSMCMVVLSTITATFVGYVFAYAVARVNLPGKSVFRAIIILQLISLPFSSGLAFLLLFGRNGLITSTLLRVTVDLYGLPGLWFVQTLSFFPVAYLVLAGVLRTIDPTLEYAARNLGAGGRNVFVDVILPLSIPGVANAMLLVALNVLADFGNPILIGGNFSVLATEIYLQVAGVVSNFGMAGVFSIFLLVPVVSIFLIQKYLVSKRRSSYDTANLPVFTVCEMGPLHILRYYINLGSADLRKHNRRSLHEDLGLGLFLLLKQHAANNVPRDSNSH